MHNNSSKSLLLLKTLDQLTNPLTTECYRDFYTVLRGVYMMFVLSQNMHILKTAPENEILSLYGSSTVKIAWHGLLRTRRKSCFYGPSWWHVCCLLHGPPISNMWYDSCLCCCWSVNQLQRRAGAQSRSWRTAQECISDLFPPLSDWNLVCGLTHLWDHKTNITRSP